MTIGYFALSSSAGIAAFSAVLVDFGASDVPMTAREQGGAKASPITQVPVALGGEGVVYNLSLPAGARLHLTGPVLAAIFLGQITRWTDPAITALNPGLSFPPARINVVHRSDGSGTTCIFSNYLPAPTRPGPPRSAPARHSAGRPGKAPKATAEWPPQSTGPRFPSATSSRPTPRACCCRSRDPHQAGNCVIPSAQTVAADAAQKHGITPADFSIVNQPGAASDPISGYSWALVYTRQHNQATGQALVTMLDWLTHHGQADADAHGYVPLSAQIRQLARTMLQQITGLAGTHLLS